MNFESKRARAWLDRLTRSRRMQWLLDFLSLLETIVVPVPIKVVLIPPITANRGRIWCLRP